MALKDRIIKAMAHKNCQIPELASVAKVKAPSVHGWVNGTSKTLKAGPAIRAAAYLGVNPLWLAEGDGEMLGAVSYSIKQLNTVLAVKEPDPILALEAELIAHTRNMNDRGLILLIDQAEQIAARHPKDQGKAA
jgi:hypothetical protein